MKRMPQPIPYQGSKRNLAHQILTFFPVNIDTLIEPFAGSASISVAASYYQKAQHFLLNDLNEPLIALLKEMVEEPDKIADEYDTVSEWAECITISGTEGSPGGRLPSRVTYPKCNSGNSKWYYLERRGGCRLR